MPADELSEKDTAETSGNPKTTDGESADVHPSPSNTTPTPTRPADNPTVTTTEVISESDPKTETSTKNILPVDSDENIPVTDSKSGETALSPSEASEEAKQPSELSELNVVQNSPVSDSQVSLEFEDAREDFLDTPMPPEMAIDEEGSTHDESVQEQSDVTVESGKKVSGESDKPVSPGVSPKRLKAVINCVPRALPDHVAQHFKGEIDCKNRKRKLSKSGNIILDDPGERTGIRLSDAVVKNGSDNGRVRSSDENKRRKQSGSRKPSSQNQKSSTDAVPLSYIVDKSSELDKSDKFYDIKRILLQATRHSSGVNLQRYRQFSNIFLKNWRFSKQFPRNTNARGKQVIYNTLEKIVKELYENELIRLKGPEENVDVIKMLTEELKHDNSRMFSQTPPKLTVLITAELFDKYFTGGMKELGPGVTAPKRGNNKSVNLGSATNQWIKLKDELGMESHEEVASILMHCYKAWISVACSKCRRHMEVGMEEKSGRNLSNSETAVCIVSCDCGKSTSGGFMIECDVCHKWQHGFCVNVDKDNIPENYSCSWCRKIRGKVVLEKGEESDDSVVSIDNTELCSTDDSEPEVIELD